MKALVVDDSRIMRNIIINILKEKKLDGDDILDAPEGKTALEILNKETIDLLFVDWNMPKLNGLDLVKIVRKMEKYKDLPIIMVTSEAARYNVLEAIKAGVTDYIVKPITGMTVMEKIKAYM